MTNRPCTKSGCDREAVATLTYVYAESVAVIGPLSLNKEPNAYDLCRHHSDRMVPPEGWQLVRHTSLNSGLNAAPKPDQLKREDF